MNRNRIFLLLSICLTLGSAASLVVALDQRAVYTRGWENAAVPEMPLPFRVPLVGVNAELSQYDVDTLGEHLALMAELGITWVRQTFPWSAIEPEPGQYRWDPWDQIVEAVAAQEGLQLVAVLNLPPRWARDPLAVDQATAPPAEADQFAHFARRFAERYGSRIHAYQIWDEPNLTAAWGNLDPKPADYVALLQAAYTAIHDMDADATVIAAGLAPTTERGPRNISDVLYLQAIYENGGRGAFDAAAGKPYGFGAGPDDRRVDAEVLNFSRLILLREEMVRHGDAEKPLWGSHFGWNALPADWDGAPSPWGAVTREEQVQYTQAAYARAAQEWPWSGGLILQHWQPVAAADDPMWGFAVIPIGAGVEEAAVDWFDGIAASGAGSGRYHPRTGYASYSGEWEFSELGADLGQQGDSEVTFTFTGSEAALELRRNDYRAYLFLTVDSQPSSLLPMDQDGRSYVILTADDLAPHTDTITVAGGLPYGEHILHLRAERGWDQWALAAYRVGVRPETGSYDAVVLISLVVLLASVMTAAVSLYRLPRSQVSIVAHLWQRFGQTGQLIMVGAASLALMLNMLLTWQDHVPALIRRDSPGLLVGLLTAGVLYFSPSFILVLISAGLLWWLIYQRIELGLLLTLFWAPFFLFPVELYQYALPMAEISVLLTASAWLLRIVVGWSRGRQRRGGDALPRFAFINRMNALDWGMVLLFVVGTLAVTWSVYRAEALREWRTLFLEPMLFYVMLRTSVLSREAIGRLVGVFVLVGVVVALLGIVMYVSGEGVITAEGGIWRLAGVYGSPNNVGLFLGRVVPFVVAFWLMTTRNFVRVTLGLILLILLAVVALSQSAGTIFLGIPAGIGMVLLLWHWRRGSLIIVATAVAGLLATIPLSQHPRFSRLLDFSSGTSFFRLRLWQSALQMIADHPLRGLGLDQFLYAYRGRYILPDAWQEPNLSHPHNILLDFWTRLGIGGVFAIGWIQVAFWRSAWRVYQATDDTLRKALSMGAMGSMAALLAHGLVDNSVFVPDLAYVFALLVALPSLLQAVKVDGSP